MKTPLSVCLVEVEGGLVDEEWSCVGKGCGGGWWLRLPLTGRSKKRGDGMFGVLEARGGGGCQAQKKPPVYSTSGGGGRTGGLSCGEAPRVLLSFTL